jgi:hypothetical protein
MAWPSVKCDRCGKLDHIVRRAGWIRWPGCLLKCNVGLCRYCAWELREGLRPTKKGLRVEVEDKVSADTILGAGRRRSQARGN